MFKFRTNILFFGAIFSFIVVQASYQAEHHADLDETMRYQFIQHQDIREQLGQNFFNALPFQPLLQGMLDGIHPYQLLLIDTDTASPYVVIKSTASYAYLVGKPKTEQLSVIIQELSKYKNLVVLCDESLQTYFVQHGFGLQSRIEFEHDVNQQLSLPEIPEGFTLKPLDIALFKQSPWFGFISSLHMSSQRFLDIGFGFALVNKDGVSVAQAYGAMVSHTSCEIGVITHSDYRGKGYILHPAIATVQECLQRNIKPVWSCNSENIASLKTACKLGFKIKRHYVFLKKF